MSDLLVKLFGWKAAAYHRAPAAFPHYLWLKSHLRPGPVRTLDVGCGTGVFTMLAASLGNDALGISDNEASNAKATERAKIAGLPNAEFRTINANEISQCNLGRFDQIIFLECLEHILDDRRAVTNLASLLMPGGQLLLTTPNADHKPYYRELENLTEGVETGWGHVRFGYTHPQIEKLFEHAGLAVTEQGFLSGFIAIKVNNLFLRGAEINLPAAWAATFPLRALQLFDRPVTRLLKYPYLSITTVGIKT